MFPPSQPNNASLPGTNPRVPNDIADIEFGHDVYTREFLERTKLLFGNEYTSPAYGIVDEDAAYALSSEDTARALQVMVDPSNAQALKVMPGIAVCEAGFMFIISTALTGVTIPFDDGTCQYVAMLRWGTVSAGQRAGYDSTVQASRQEYMAEADSVSVISLVDFLALDADDLKLSVPLAVITSTADCANNEIITVSVDTGITSYAWNRPWFSVVDVQHRALVGTGPSSIPHSLSLNDLGAASGASLWQLASHKGFIISRDVSFPGIPGIRCTEDLTGRISTNTDPLPDVQEVALDAYPNYISDAWDADDAENTAKHYHAPWKLNRTNLAFWDKDETADDATTPTVEYYATYALMPPTDLSGARLTFGEPTSTVDYLIANGKVMTAATSYDLDLSSMGSFPQPFRVYAVATEANTAQLVSSPQVLSASTKLADMTTPLSLADQELTSPARLRIGLAGVSPDGSTPDALDVQLVVYGTDTAGDSATETVTFSGADDTASNYWESPTPCTTDSDEVCKFNPKNFAETLATFASVETITLSVNTGVVSPTGAYIAVYAMIAPGNSTITSENTLDDAIAVCSGMWTGARACDIRDERVIYQSLVAMARTSATCAAMSMGIGNSDTTLFALVEDMLYPQVISTKHTLMDRTREGISPFSVLGSFVSADDPDTGSFFVPGEMYVSKVLNLALSSDEHTITVQLVDSAGYITHDPTEMVSAAKKANERVGAPLDPTSVDDYAVWIQTWTAYGEACVEVEMDDTSGIPGRYTLARGANIFVKMRLIIRAKYAQGFLLTIAPTP